MPEIAEVKIMSDFVNFVSSQEMYFDKVEKSEVSKVKTDLNVFDDCVFSLNAKSRGKEMILNFLPVGSSYNGMSEKKLSVTLGMSGNFVYVKKDSTELDRILKHSHLRLKTISGNFIVLHDVRRFAKWKWVEGWNSSRGHCPLTEYDEFSADIRFKWKNHKVFRSPLNEVLMNQALFNGIGNYMRSEILYRLDVNPFQSIGDLSNDKLEELLKICHTCCRDAYQLGGGQLKDWVNPAGVSDKNFAEWMKCYQKGISIVDKTGRRFWFDQKWKVE